MAFDRASYLRRRIIKDNSTFYWVYNRLLLHFLLEIFEHGFWKAVQIFFFRITKFIEQHFLLNDYLDWIISNEPLPFDLRIQKKFSLTFGNHPYISIVTPVYRPQSIVLKKMLDSVMKQTYPFWEHCIVNADQSDMQTRTMLEEYSRKDSRFKVKQLERNFGISENSNHAIQMAQGDWIGFLDHDDQLAPFALFEVVRHINEHENVDAIYSDEDKIDPDNNQRFSPFFKPDLDIYYLRGLNYLNHFFVVRKEAGDRIGWLNPSFDGSQDYDFILRLIDNNCAITHISKILYHWTSIEGSTSTSASNKQYSIEAGEEALKNHLQRNGIDAEVCKGEFPYRTRYTLPGRPKISIIIPNRDNACQLKALVNSITDKTNYDHYEVIIVENNSQNPETFQYYDELSTINTIKVVSWEDEFHYSEVCNYGEKHASGEVIQLLNNDMEVINGDWLEEMLGLLLQPNVGVVGAKLLYPDDTIQHAGVIVGMFGVAGHSHRHYPHNSAGYFHRLSCVQRYSAVTAACLMVKRDVFREVGGMDPAFELEFGDVDFCLRVLSKGYINLWTPFAKLYHFESQTRGGYDTIEKKELNMHEASLFKARWSEFLGKGDPSYNINLTIRAEDFGIRT